MHFAFTFVEELYKGKKITRWFSSYFSKDAGQVMSDVSTNIEVRFA